VPIVVDASIVLAPVLEEPIPKGVIDLDKAVPGDWIAPALWWFEVRNGLVVNERRRRITEADTTQFLDRISDLASIDQSPDETTVMALARRHRLTVYDAAYLELALREGADLATLDAELAEAARREGVAVIGDPA
jgi:predicted nucleic acid-binding protein